MLARRVAGTMRIVVSALILATSAPALAASSSSPSPAATSTDSGPPPPGETRSHYLTTVDAGTLKRTGTADALDAEAQGLTDAMVVLDAGTPSATDGSVRLPDSHLDATPAQVAKAAVAYGKAWLVAKGPALVLVVGTNNYGSYAGGPHGAAWARMVETVSEALPSLDVRGGLDAEQEYSTPLAARSWVEAFDASGTRPYVDFGSCTCPPAPDPPANGWTTEDVYAVAVGDGRAVVLPEIYSTKGGNARAWGRLVTWSRQHHPDLPVRLAGALTQSGACVGRSCQGTDLTPRPAWAQLTTALGLTTDPGADLRYLTDISYLPQPGRRHDHPLGPFGGPLGITLLVLAGAVVSTAVAANVRRRRRPQPRRSTGRRSTGRRSKGRPGRRAWPLRR
jgi:hypothetical protein